MTVGKEESRDRKESRVGGGEGRGECGKEDSVKRVRVGKEESRDRSESRVEGGEGRSVGRRNL